MDDVTASRSALVASPASAREDEQDARPALLERAGGTLKRAVDHLLSLQKEDGHWCAELEGDSILQSEYILMKWILGHEDDQRLPRIANYLRAQQQADGSWVQFPGAEQLDLSATVKGYFVLKLMGDDPQAEHMRKAREQVLKHGGAEKCNSFTKFYLAALGQISWEANPAIPPELVFLPKWFYFHLDKISAWTRTMILPLSLVTTFKPTRRLSPEQSIDELYIDEKRRHRLVPGQDRPHWVWSPFFMGVDKLLKWVGKLGMTPVRGRAVKWIEKWLIEHLGESDGLGAIYPPMVYIQIAFRCLGYADDHPLLIKARKDLDDLMLEDEAADTIRLQPCFSPVWDTGIAAYALTDAGLDGSHPGMKRCVDWLLAKECHKKADWAKNVDVPVAASGWFFEYENAFYPDVDDTVMVSMALHRTGDERAIAAGWRGVHWALAMQNDDGGFAAFDRTWPHPIMEYIPFADHNAVQDPSCADITGRTLECLGHHGYRPNHPAVQRAVEFLKQSQEADGCWIGRWGVNYIYGTWQALGGLWKIGYDMNAPWVQRAGRWLKEHQQADGAFGESAQSYEDESLRGQGPATASQTAWGTMAMMAVYGPGDEDVQRGIAWLCQTQLDSGTWEEKWFTGTGFPRAFYLRYHLYRLYFPVMAIGRWRRLMDEAR